MDLTDRVAVITGATGGLGYTLTKELAARRVKLALLDIDPAKLEILAGSLALPAPQIYTQVVDLLDSTQAAAAAGSIAERFGRIDILLHVVGGWTGGKTLLEAPSTDLTFMLNQHVWTSFNVIQAFVPHLIRNQWGRIIMVTSPYAARPNPKGGPYAIGKAGQETLMLALSQELKGSRVTANLLQAKTIDMKREKVSAPSADNATWTTPEELSAAMLYLLSDEAAAINGAKIPLYGSF